MGSELRSAFVLGAGVTLGGVVVLVILSPVAYRLVRWRLRRRTRRFWSFVTKGQHSAR